MKRTPNPHPDWLQTCSIRHASASVIAFPVIDDLAALLWVVNLGCIDLNQWCARCDDINRPDYLHFDLYPVADSEGKPTRWKLVLETACAVRDALHALQLPSYPKTSGSRGNHVYVPIVRGPLQKQVRTFAKRPAGRVLVDYNQNAWGRTLASVYSVRPRPKAPVSTLVTWDEVAAGFRMADFNLRNVPERVRERGDLFLPLLQPEGRASLERFVGGAAK